ncbi:hypothetical protein M3J09_004718 [Ascochyta lentis]
MRRSHSPHTLKIPSTNSPNPSGVVQEDAVVLDYRRAKAAAVVSAPLKADR